MNIMNLHMNCIKCGVYWPGCGKGTGICPECGKESWGTPYKVRPNKEEAYMLVQVLLQQCNGKRKDMAEALGCCYKSACKYSNGTMTPSFQMLDRIKFLISLE